MNEDKMAEEFRQRMHAALDRAADQRIEELQKEVEYWRSQVRGLQGGCEDVRERMRRKLFVKLFAREQGQNVSDWLDADAMARIALDEADTALRVYYGEGEK